MKIKHIITIGVVGVCFVFASMVFAKPAFSATQTEQLQKIIHDYIVNNPQVLIEASQTLQTQQIAKMVEVGTKLAKQNTDELFRNKKDLVFGNPKGTVTLVEFFDYQCVICREMSNAVETVIKNNPDLRVVYKDFPVHGDNSVLAAKAAFAADKQGKYIQFHNAIMDSETPITQDTLNQFAKQTGLDMSQYKSDMNQYSQEVDSMLHNNEQLAMKLQLAGTPSFIIGKSDAGPNSTIGFYPGRTSLSDLQTMIDKVKAS